MRDETETRLLEAIEQHADRALKQRLDLLQTQPNPAIHDHIAVIAADDETKAQLIPPGFDDPLFFMTMHGVQSQFSQMPDLLAAVEKSSPANLRILALGWGRYVFQELPLKTETASA